MIRAQLTIVNKLGLHARAAAKFVACTSVYASCIKVGINGELVNAKSIMQVMMLAAGKGTVLDVEVDGHDEEVALAALRELIENRFEEPE